MRTILWPDSPSPTVVLPVAVKAVANKKLLSLAPLIASKGFKSLDPAVHGKVVVWLHFNLLHSFDSN